VRKIPTGDQEIKTEFAAWLVPLAEGYFQNASVGTRMDTTDGTVELIVSYDDYHHCAYRFDAMRRRDDIEYYHYAFREIAMRLGILVFTKGS
jgi:hypothetical protein